MPGDANQRDTEEAAATSTSPLGETIWVTAIHLRNPGLSRRSFVLAPFALESVVRKLGKILYSTPLTPNLWRICLPTFAGKVTFGSVRATSAIDLSMLWFTGVAIKAWMLPASGPL
jgi:hypothetical protein